MVRLSGPWQCAYKRARSCADIVWCQRVLLSVVQRKKWEYHRMGIDMSSAFDTIKRTTILELLKLCGCTEDELRIVRLLLSNTKLRVKVNGVLSAEFLSLLGAFRWPSGVVASTYDSHADDRGSIPSGNRFGWMQVAHQTMV